MQGEVQVGYLEKLLPKKSGNALAQAAQGGAGVRTVEIGQLGTWLVGMVGWVGVALDNLTGLFQAL